MKGARSARKLRVLGPIWPLPVTTSLNNLYATAQRERGADV